MTVSSLIPNIDATSPAVLPRADQRTHSRWRSLNEGFGLGDLPPAIRLATVSATAPTISAVFNMLAGMVLPVWTAKVHDPLASPGKWRGTV